MEGYELRKIVTQYQKELCYYSQMQVFLRNPYEYDHYQSMINQRTDEFINQMMELTVNTKQIEPEPESEQESETVKEFTEEELSQYNGMDGRPVYVAVNGIVYDLTTSPAWAGGIHNGIRSARDLTRQFLGCHAGITDRLEAFPRVGILKK